MTESFSIILKSLEPVLLPALESLKPLFFLIWEILKNFWWVLIPVILFPRFKTLYLWYMREGWAKTVKFVVLEIKIPKELPKSVKAMEYVFSALWGVGYDAPAWKEKWLEGQFQLPLSFEITSFEGEPHFFIRTPQMYQNAIESAFYAQYPEIEISEVQDYTANIPRDVPNQNWDLVGFDYKMLKSDVYPIKTYFDFEADRESKEEKKIDPLALLLEGMTKFKKGEQLWVQIIVRPVTNDENDWIDRGRALRDRLAKRPLKTKSKPILQEAAQILITGKPTETSGKTEEVISSEMKLTPGEKDVVSAIERKISKSGFLTNIRFLYLGKKEAFFKPKIKIPLGFFAQYSTQNLNALVPLAETAPKIKWVLVKRRTFIRKRKLFRRYINRLSPFSPRPGGTFILNTEELASLYHFPGIVVVPTPAIPRIEAKKGEAPRELPFE